MPLPVLLAPSLVLLAGRNSSCCYPCTVLSHVEQFTSASGGFCLTHALLQNEITRYWEKKVISQISVFSYPSVICVGAGLLCCWMTKEEILFWLGQCLESTGICFITGLSLPPLEFITVTAWGRKNNGDCKLCCLSSMKRMPHS